MCPVGFTTLLQLQLRLSGVRFFPRRPRRAIPRRCAEQIDKQPISPRHSFRQLPEKSEAGINVNAFTGMHVHETAVQRRLARIIHGQQRRIFRIELRPKIQPALLHPALKVLRRDLVRGIQQGIIRLQESDGRILVRDARQRPRRLRSALLAGGSGGEICAGYGAYWNLSQANSRWYCTTSVPPLET